MALINKFITGFTLVGLLISLLAGFLFGNRLFSVLITAFVCAIVSAFVGAGVYKILEMRVPEFLELFQGLGRAYSGDSSEFNSDGDESNLEARGGLEAEGGMAFADDTSSIPVDTLPGHSNIPDKAQVFGDHILLNNIMIKNEPKIIASAIRTMLAKDD